MKDFVSSQERMAKFSPSLNWWKEAIWTAVLAISLYILTVGVMAL